VLLALAVAACGDDGTGPDPVATTSVSIEDDRFTPQHIRVSPGATVTWTWTGSNNHNVNFAAAGIADSPFQTAGQHQGAMPSTPGTYAYECQVHSGMNGSVLVQ
jgi:plastocyanin